MSKPATLFDSDNITAMGNVLLHDDDPMSPAYLLWKGMLFQATGMGPGNRPPGDYSNIYTRIIPAIIPDDSVTLPKVEPDTVI